MKEFIQKGNRLAFIVLLTAISSLSYSQAVTHYYTLAAGDYTNTTYVWSKTSYTGAVCSCAPPCNIPANTYIHINKPIVANCPILDIGSNSTFIIDAGGSFELVGGASVTGTGSLSVASGATLTVTGNLAFTGGGDATINGYADVTGTVSISGGGSSVCGSGVLVASALSGSPCGALSLVILPIELLDFSAVCLTNGVQLNWSTASETENDYFLIERSTNGFDWIPVTKVTGNGTSSNVNKYVHTDYHNARELTYYRLSQVDKNQTKTVFKAIDVQCNHSVKDNIVFFPNPSSTELNILLNVNSTSQSNIIRLLDNMGKVVFESMVDLNEGINTFVYPIDFEPGSYNLMISSDNITIPIQKLMVVKP